MEATAQPPGAARTHGGGNAPAPAPRVPSTSAALPAFDARNGPELAFRRLLTSAERLQGGMAQQAPGPAAATEAGAPFNPEAARLSQVSQQLATPACIATAAMRTPPAPPAPCARRPPAARTARPPAVCQQPEGAAVGPGALHGPVGVSRAGPLDTKQPCCRAVVVCPNIKAHAPSLACMYARTHARTQAARVQAGPVPPVRAVPGGVRAALPAAALLPEARAKGSAAPCAAVRRRAVRGCPVGRAAWRVQNACPWAVGAQAAYACVHWPFTGAEVCGLHAHPTCVVARALPSKDSAPHACVAACCQGCHGAWGRRWVRVA